VTISSLLNFDQPAPPGRGSAAGRKYLAPPYYSQRAVFASPLSAFFIVSRYQNVSVLEFIGAKDDGCGEWWQWEISIMQISSQIVATNKPTPRFLQAGCPSFRPTNSVRVLFLSAALWTILCWINAAVRNRSHLKSGTEKTVQLYGL